MLFCQRPRQYIPADGFHYKFQLSILLTIRFHTVRASHNPHMRYKMSLFMSRLSYYGPIACYTIRDYQIEINTKKKKKKGPRRNIKYSRQMPKKEEKIT